MHVHSFIPAPYTPLNRRHLPACICCYLLKFCFTALLAALHVDGYRPCMQLEAKQTLLVLLPVLLLPITPPATVAQPLSLAQQFTHAETVCSQQWQCRVLPQQLAHETFCKNTALQRNQPCVLTSLSAVCFTALSNLSKTSNASMMTNTCTCHTTVVTCRSMGIVAVCIHWTCTCLHVQRKGIAATAVSRRHVSPNSRVHIAKQCGC